MVITLPLHTNYGGILQAYALQRALAGYGHEATLARFAPGLMRRICHPVAVWLKQRGLVSYRHDYPLTEYEHSVVRGNTEEFIKKHIRRTAPLTGRRLSRAGFDAFVAGSDQVWRHYDPRYFLDFLPGCNRALRIAYAASFGIGTWPFLPGQTEELRRLASRFDAVSVREDSGVELCRSFLGVEACRMPDPTLLLGSEHYTALAGESIAKVGENTVMTYILDRTASKSEVVRSVCAEMSLEEHAVGAKQTPGRGVEITECAWPSVEDWLAGFARCKYVVTDSFHGTVFAILFNKPFISICNDERGAARFDSLLRTFGLESRLINARDELPEGLIRQKIDFRRVNGIIEEERARADSFLRSALAGKDNEK